MHVARLCFFVGIVGMVVALETPTTAAPPTSSLGTMQTTPAPSATPSAAATPHTVWLSGGVGAYAASQGDTAPALLAGLEAAFASVIYQTSGTAVRFHPAKDGECASSTDGGLLELTYGQTGSIDDDYFVVEHFSQVVNIGAALLDCTDRGILAYEPILPSPGVGSGQIYYRPAFVTYQISNNSLSFVGIAGALSIANANNPDKTSAAVVTFIGGAKSVTIPSYHKDDKVATVWQDATFGEAYWLLRCMDLGVRERLFGIAPNDPNLLPSNAEWCPPPAQYRNVPFP